MFYYTNYVVTFIFIVKLKLLNIYVAILQTPFSYRIHSSVTKLLGWHKLILQTHSNNMIRFPPQVATSMLNQFAYPKI